MTSDATDAVIIGGGAAGFFGAIRYGELHRSSPPILLEKGSQLLTKVRISGGGRCNVTHAAFEPAELVKYYPRGHKALRGPFTRFQPKDTIEWFASRGVELKAEPDGRMFPITDSSQTIIDCLVQAAAQAGVDVRCHASVESIEKGQDGFLVHVAGQSPIACRSLLVATGSNRTVWKWLEALGHTIVPPVPSLFTFNVPTSLLKELAGVSVDPVTIKIVGTQLSQTGPLLITHWGFSGPAVLKLSAWGARELHDRDYKAEALINWLPNLDEQGLLNILKQRRETHANRSVASESPVPLPRSLWRALTTSDSELLWNAVSNTQLREWMSRLHADTYHIDGKTTYKEEFVTCGGVSLDNVDFRTMESRICPGLHFAGEVLDVDGVTGGFNFQAAWTTSFIAASAMK